MLFSSDAKILKRRRAEFEDIRRRALFEFNSYQQYWFALNVEDACKKLDWSQNSDNDGPPEIWRKISDKWRLEAAETEKKNRQKRNAEEEAIYAGSFAIAILAIWIELKSYSFQESRILTSDINDFVQKTLDFLANRTSTSDKIEVPS